MSVILIHTERFVDHEPPPGHPERPERAETMEVVANRWRERGVEVVAPRAATHEQLARVHTDQHLQTVAATRGRAVQLDPDTFTSPDTYEIALLAAGAGIDAVERVMGGSHRAAVAMVRPPGHHAERDRAMGFCLYNNAAVAAAHARAQGASKVALVDYDVHHGNGTQHIFEHDPAVLYISMHQYPYYPGTGAVDDVGRGAGRGFTINLPLEAGAVAEDYRAVFAGVVTPVLRQFEPDLIVVSAGFDAHEDDPLGGMRLTAPSFGAMMKELRAVADECCRGRIVSITEGGYDLKALSASLDSAIDALHAPIAPGEALLGSASHEWPQSGIASERGRTTTAQARAVLRPFWHLP